MSEVLDLFGSSDSKNNNNNQSSTNENSHETGYNYVPEDDNNNNNNNRQNNNNMSPRTADYIASNENASADRMLSSNIDSQNYSPPDHNIRRSNRGGGDITSAAFHQGQNFTFDQFLIEHRNKLVGCSLLVMFIIVFALMIGGSKDAPHGANCQRVFNGTCRGFLSLVPGSDWQLFGDLTGCPISQKCVTDTFYTKNGQDPIDNCSPILNQLWARPPRDHPSDRNHVEETCCRTIAGVELFGFGEILLQALTTTLVGMFLNSPFPLMFFRWLHEKLACCGYLCCCFSAIAMQDDDSRDRLDSWYERNSALNGRIVERVSLTGNNNNIDDDDEGGRVSGSSAFADDEGEDDGFTSSSSRQNNNNVNTNVSVSTTTVNNNNSNSSPSSVVDPSKPFQFTWIDYLFIPSTLFKYKIACQVIAQAWLAIMYAMMTDGTKSPSTHLNGADWFFRYTALVAHTMNGGVFITLVEFISFIACYHLIELRRTSIDPFTHRIEATTHFMFKLQTMFYTPIDSEGNVIRNAQQQSEAGASFGSCKWIFTSCGQILMWAAGISVGIVMLPSMFTHIVTAQFYFMPWLCLLAFAFFGVFALVFWICDSWMRAFRPIYFSNSEEEQKEQQEQPVSSYRSRNMRVFLSILGRIIVVLAVNVIFLEVYLAPVNAMAMTYLFDYQGEGYVKVMFDESSMHSSTCAMKYKQNENFGAVLDALLFYL